MKIKSAVIVVHLDLTVAGTKNAAQMEYKTEEGYSLDLQQEGGATFLRIIKLRDGKPAAENVRYVPLHHVEYIVPEK
jgi:hypothetical protein